MSNKSTLQEIIPEELFQEIVSSLLESDDYYASLTTPLKTVDQVKAEHKHQIDKALRFKDFEQRMNEGVDTLIHRLPKIVSKEAWEQLIEEFANADEHMINAAQYIDVEEDESVVLQELMGISNGNMGIIYALGRQLLEEKDYPQAVAIFSLLNYLNPLVPEYALGSGLSLFLAGKYDEALKTLHFAEILQPDKAAPLIYSCLCHLNLNHLDELKEELSHVEEVFHHSHEEQKQWKNLYNSLKHEVNNKIKRK